MSRKHRYLALAAAVVLAVMFVVEMVVAVRCLWQLSR